MVMTPLPKTTAYLKWTCETWGLQAAAVIELFFEKGPESL